MATQKKCPSQLKRVMGLSYLYMLQYIAQSFFVSYSFHFLMVNTVLYCISYSTITLFS